MYKEDVIYEKWKRQITEVNSKFFRSKKKKLYINRPYFEKDTVVDDSIVDFNEIRKNLEDELSSSFLGVSSLFLCNSITVLDIEPLYQPYMFNGIEVYDIKHISPIKTIDFCTPMSYNSYSNQSKIITGATRIPRPFSFDRLQYMMTKALINSYYGITANDYFMEKTRICIVVNKTWKLFVELAAPESYVLTMIVSLYNSGITSFDSLANIKSVECAKSEIVSYIRYEDCQTKLFDDVLNYPKPSRFRVELFKTLKGSSDHYNLDSYYVDNRFVTFRDIRKSIRSDIKGFIRDYTTRLLSAMNKYGDIIDNSENICL